MIWRINLLLGLMVACIPALATAASLVWEPPTTRVDGSPLPAEEIDKYELCISQSEQACLAEPEPQSTPGLFFYEVSASPLPIKSLDLDPGLWYFTIRTVDTGGLISEWATPVFHEIKARPNTPTNFKILP